MDEEPEQRRGPGQGSGPSGGDVGDVGDVGDEHDRPGPSVERGSAAEALREAARQLLAHATLDDLTSFVTVSRLTEGTGLSSGAVYSAFDPEAGVGPRPRSAPQAAVRDAYLAMGADNDELVSTVQALFEDSVANTLDSEQDLMSVISQVLAAPVTAAARGLDGGNGWSYSHLWLGGVVALNDEGVRDFLREAYAGYDAAYEPPLALLLESARRELVEGISLRQFSAMLITVADGCALRLRFDPSFDESMIARLYIGVWLALTRRVDDRDDRLGHRLAVGGRGPLRPTEADAVRAAVLRVSERAGWPAVTLAKVGQIAGVSDARLAGIHPSRHDLAPIVWAHVVDGVERRAAGRSAAAAPDRLGALVHDVVESACSQRALMSSLLIARLQTTSQPLAEVTDPATERVVEVLAAAMRDAAVDVGSAPAGAADGYRVLARTALDAVTLRAATSSIRSDELAAVVLDGLSGTGLAVPAAGPGGDRPQ